MKLSVGSRSRRWAAGAALFAWVFVMAILGASTKAARASGAPAAAPVAADSAPVTPGIARAEADILDLQLD